MGKHRKERKDIDVKQTNINYSGSRSPYWDYLSEGGRDIFDTKNIEGLSERDAIHRQRDELTPEQEFQLYVIRETWAVLTPTQKRVVSLVGEKGLTLSQAAGELGITKDGVMSILTQARKKVAKLYEKIKSEEVANEL